MKKIYQVLFLRRIRQLVNEEEMEAVNENTIKHIKIFSVMILLLPIAIITKIAPNYWPGNETLMWLTGEIKPTNLGSIIMVTGTAWFVITFGAIPKRLESVAMDITFWMFMGFVLSGEYLITYMCIDSPINSPFLILIYVAVYTAAVQYDTMDILKAGLDEAQLKFARLGRSYFRRELGPDGEPAEQGID